MQILNRMTELGVFGNANPNYVQDWQAILAENIDGISNPNATNSIWDADTSACTHVAGLEL